MLRAVDQPVNTCGRETFRPWAGFQPPAPTKAENRGFRHIRRHGDWGHEGQLYWLQGLCGGGSISSLTATAMRIGLEKALDGCRRSRIGQRTGIRRTSPCRGTLDRWVSGQPGNLFPPDRLASAGWQRYCHDSRPRIHRMSEPLVVDPRLGVDDSVIQLTRLPLHVFLGWARVLRDAGASGRVTSAGSMHGSRANIETNDRQPRRRIA